jgi:crotonobetainyl-CoA:carnitine CoA-transferase CaiB-like acyl-CoA transferase
MNNMPLQGVEVLDLSRVLAGPLCTQYLGDMGASIVKVESVDHGDDMRTWPPFKRSEDGRSVSGTPYLAINRNKRSIAVDLKTVEGREVVYSLVRRADIVIESFGPGAAARLGLDASAVRVLNPRAIHCSISGYGTKGPMRGGKGYDMILQAFSAMMTTTGEKNGGPVRIGFSPVDQGTGLHALIGILAALHARNVTGEGSAIEASLFDTATGFHAHMLQNYWQRGTEPKTYGVGHESLVPYDAFETADKPLILGVANDRMWKDFCSISGLDIYAEDPRFLTNGDRVLNRDDCVALVQEAMRKHPRDKWIVELEAIGIPGSPIHTLGELSNHRHARESGMIFDYEHPAFGPMSAVAQPIRFNGERMSLRRHPPLRGEHTQEVLEELGLKQSEIEQLHSRGVVRSPG